MGTVLFLVYLAGVSDSLDTMLLVFGMATLGIGVFAQTFASVEGAPGDAARVWSALRKLLPYTVASLVLAAFMPSKNLLYIAAGLKAGQEVAQTELAQKAYGALEQQLDKLLESVE